MGHIDFDALKLAQRLEAMEQESAQLLTALDQIANDTSNPRTLEEARQMIARLQTTALQAIEEVSE